MSNLTIQMLHYKFISSAPTHDELRKPIIVLHFTAIFHHFEDCLRLWRLNDKPKSFQHFSWMIFFWFFSIFVVSF